jgi:hypothetical protein
MDQATYDRSSENGEFNLSMAEGRIFRGALPTASQLIGQNLQQAAGEREFYDGLSDLARAR